MGSCRYLRGLLIGACAVASGTASAESLPSAVSHVYYVSGGFSVSGAINESTVAPLFGAEVSAAARVGLFLPWITIGGQFGDGALGYVEAGAWAIVNLGVGYGFGDGDPEPYLFAGAPIPVRLGVWRRNWLITVQPYARVQITEGRSHEAGVLWKFGLPMF